MGFLLLQLSVRFGSPANDNANHIPTALLRHQDV